MSRLVSILLLIALALMPAATSICLAGDDPACCAPVSSGSRSSDTELSGRACDCCVTIEALPFDRTASVSRPISASVAVAVLTAPTSLPSQAPRCLELLPAAGAAESRPSSIRTVVLLV
jgi:hypothetical protein